MSTPAGEENLLAKCLEFCQALTSQGQVFDFSVSIGSDFTFTLDTRSKAVEKQGAKKKARNTRRRAGTRKQHQKSSSLISTNNGETANSPSVPECSQCDYKTASEKELKQHVIMKQRKPSAPLAESLRTKEESSVSLTSSPILFNIREENTQNCESFFFPGHQQCGDEVKCEWCDETFDKEDELENHKAAVCKKRFPCKACKTNCLDLGEKWNYYEFL